VLRCYQELVDQLHLLMEDLLDLLDVVVEAVRTMRVIMRPS